MQSKLNQWKGSYDKTSSGIPNPDMGSMDETAINTYMTSNAVAQDAGTLTMSDIMLQRYCYGLQYRKLERYAPV